LFEEEGRIPTPSLALIPGLTRLHSHLPTVDAGGSHPRGAATSFIFPENFRRRRSLTGLISGRPRSTRRARTAAIKDFRGQAARSDQGQRDRAHRGAVTNFRGGQGVLRHHRWGSEEARCWRRPFSRHAIQVRVPHLAGFWSYATERTIEGSGQAVSATPCRQCGSTIRRCGFSSRLGGLRGVTTPTPR
jgi:hypothetical protein